MTKPFPSRLCVLRQLLQPFAVEDREFAALEADQVRILEFSEAARDDLADGPYL